MRLNPPTVVIFLISFVLASLALITQAWLHSSAALPAAPGILALHHCLSDADGRQPRARALTEIELRRPPLSPGDRLAVAEEAAGRAIIREASQAKQGASAPSSTERVALGPPKSVLTQPGQQAFTLTPWLASSTAVMRVSALSAVFDKR